MNLSKNGFSKPSSSVAGSKQATLTQEQSSNLSLQTQNDQVDIILMFLPKYEKEYISNVKVTTKPNGDVNLSQLLDHLKGMGFPIEKNVVSYHSPGSDMYVYCGSDPISPDYFIPGSEVTMNGENKQVSIRIRQTHTTTASTIASDTNIPEKDKTKVETFGEAASGEENQKQKRTKERKIGEILDKVLQWRRLYTGSTDPTTGQVTKLSLEDAAQRVGISKKSLDDYLLQIRFGKKYGFNFNEHYHDRVGVLRAFVKKHKTKKSGKGDDDNFDFPTEFESLIQKKDKYGNEIKAEDSSINKGSKKI